MSLQRCSREEYIRERKKSEREDRGYEGEERESCGRLVRKEV